MLGWRLALGAGRPQSKAPGPPIARLSAWPLPIQVGQNARHHNQFRRPTIKHLNGPIFPEAMSPTRLKQLRSSNEPAAGASDGPPQYSTTYLSSDAIFPYASP